MTRQLEANGEQRAAAKNHMLAYVLDESLVESLESQGIQLTGLAIKHDAYSCLLTLKGHSAGIYQVAFVGSDTIVNCFLKAWADSKNDLLVWKEDKYRR